MIAIIDYGMGNLRSVQKALEKVGAKTLITQNAKEIESADKIVLPGVGAMGPAMEILKNLDLIAVIKKVIQADKPFLGICLGLQLLFEQSEEGGEVRGLGIFPGTVEKFQALKVPHMGWNQLKIKNKNCPILKGLKNFSPVYFCHSYFVKPRQKETIAGSTEYGVDFASSICHNNLFAVQFHPEKSQTVGLKILENFVKI